MRLLKYYLKRVGEFEITSLATCEKHFANSHTTLTLRNHVGFAVLLAVNTPSHNLQAS